MFFYYFMLSTFILLLSDLNQYSGLMQDVYSYSQALTARYHWNFINNSLILIMNHSFICQFMLCETYAMQHNSADHLY